MVVMLKSSKKKGVALFDYTLIAILFAVVLGFSVLQIKPEMIRKLFIRSTENTGTITGGTLEIKALGAHP